MVAKDPQDSPIADLKKGDLRAFDNGVEQTILSFEKLGAGIPTTNGGATDSTATDDRATGRRAPRISIILLDAINTSRAAQIYGRKAVSEMLRNLPQSEDMIAIFALGDSLHLLHAFSTNTASLRAAVDGYEGEHPYIGVKEAAPFSVGAAPPPGADPFSTGVQRLALTLGALAEVARNMRGVPGEKNLLWVTGGFPPPEDHQDIEAVTRQLAAAKVMLYPIDARGLIACLGPCPPEVNLNIASMEELAEQTGGRAYHDDNGLSALARAALEDSREGYVLTYAPANYKQDRSAHKVELRTSRKGIELRYRPGYIAD